MGPPSVVTESFLDAESRLFGRHCGTHSVIIIIIIAVATKTTLLPPVWSPASSPQSVFTTALSSYSIKRVSSLTNDRDDSWRFESPLNEMDVGIRGKMKQDDAAAVGLAPAASPVRMTHQKVYQTFPNVSIKIKWKLVVLAPCFSFLFISFVCVCLSIAKSPGSTSPRQQVWWKTLI